MVTSGVGLTNSSLEQEAPISLRTSPRNVVENQKSWELMKSNISPKMFFAITSKPLDVAP